MKRKLRVLVLCLCTIPPAFLACGGNLPPTEFTNPVFDFSFVQSVAVLPFDNLSQDSEAGTRVTRIMITELLASGAVDVVEPGEVTAAVSKIPGRQAAAAATPSTQDIIALGTELGVQALILGTVTQSEVLRSAGVQRPVVSLDARMVETETGKAVWAATHTETGGTISAKVLGTGGKPLAETTRRTVRGLLNTLLE